jgi:hypothetical protein
MAKVNQAFTHPLREMDPIQVVSMAELVQQVTEHPGWALVQRCVEAHASRLTDQLLNPSIPSLEKYAALSAELRGLRSMRDAAETILAYAAEAQAGAERAHAAQE